MLAFDTRHHPIGVYVNSQLLETLEAAKQRGLPYSLKLEDVTDAAVVSTVNGLAYAVHEVLKGTNFVVGKEYVPNPT